MQLPVPISSQVVELEQRLRETFPVMVATSASTPAAAAPLPAGAAARLSLPPSLAATVGSRETHLATQHQQPQLIPVEPRLLARSVSYSFPTSSTMAIREGRITP